LVGIGVGIEKVLFDPDSDSDPDPDPIHLNEVHNQKQKKAPCRIGRGPFCCLFH
jgi:hypothetical protein